MKESRVIKILISFSLLLALFGGVMFWQQGWFKQVKGNYLAGIFDLAKNKVEEISFLTFVSDIAGFKEEKTYLLLFQNNLELRPTGGYLGVFGILKVKNGQPTFFEMHDTNIFDGFGKAKTEPPQPLKDYLKIDNWQMRDSNWSPDFPTSAQQAEYFYHLQGGQEKFDGIMAINAAVLPNLLEITGPIYLKEFDKKFEAKDVLYQLEYEVEKGYVQRGIEPGERKTIFKKLVNETSNKLIKENFWQKKEFRDLILQELKEKNILLFFKDEAIQAAVNKMDWAGQVKQDFPGDYLMTVEANLAAKKANAFIKREINYQVDFTKERPEAKLEIKYIHQGTQKDWFSDDYRAYLRVYLPLTSWLIKAEGASDQTKFLDELGKTVFGNWIEVPIGQEKTIVYNYLLPARVKNEKDYQILVQKQSGIDNLPFKIVLKTSQKEYKEEEIIESNWQGTISLEQ